VIYVEDEHLNEASRIQKEIVGSGSVAFEPIAELRDEHWVCTVETQRSTTAAISLLRPSAQWT